MKDRQKEKAIAAAEAIYKSLRDMVLTSDEARETFCGALAARISNSPYPQWHPVATAVRAAMDGLRADALRREAGK